MAGHLWSLRKLNSIRTVGRAFLSVVVNYQAAAARIQRAKVYPKPAAGNATFQPVIASGCQYVYIVLPPTLLYLSIQLSLYDSRQASRPFAPRPSSPKSTLRASSRFAGFRNLFRTFYGPAQPVVGPDRRSTCSGGCTGFCTGKTSGNAAGRRTTARPPPPPGLALDGVTIAPFQSTTFGSTSDHSSHRSQQHSYARRVIAVAKLDAAPTFKARSTSKCHLNNSARLNCDCVSLNL